MIEDETAVARKMIAAFETWNRSVESSIAGNDFSGGLKKPDPPRRSWIQAEEYRPYLKEFKQRPEYERWLKNVVVE